VTKKNKQFQNRLNLNETSLIKLSERRKLKIEIDSDSYQLYKHKLNQLKFTPVL
jgi:hypothetical protein